MNIGMKGMAYINAMSFLLSFQNDANFERSQSLNNHQISYIIYIESKKIIIYILKEVSICLLPTRKVC